MNPRLRRIKEIFTSSLYKSTFNFLSLFFPFLKHVLSETLSLLSMDSLFFSEDYSAFDSFCNQQIEVNSDLNADHLYMVHHRWWNEACESLFSSSTEIGGVLYVASSKYEFESDEIVLQMGRDDTSAEAGTSDCEYTLISEWMFLRALKWHNDVKAVGSFLLAGENMEDLFSLHLKLCFSQETNSFLVKISQKDNNVGDFNKAWAIFCAEYSLLHIWDFSGQTTQYFLNDRKSIDDLGQKDEGILLQLQVYGFSKNDTMAIEQFKNGNSFFSSSLHMNGSTEENINSYIKKTNGSNMGLAGLYNLGNTCFMNSAIQCLAHTPNLVDYFLADFRKDLNIVNPLGMNGKLALAFGDLLRKLWSPVTTTVTPNAFKSILTSFAPQFSGYNQQDSQELLAFLLDGLHEDLNRVKDKPYIEKKDVDGRPDEEVADEHWRNHLACNNSVIVNMFQGQYRSTLFCPVCKKLSVTFDPFMYLSLPLLTISTRTMTLTILSTDGTALPFPVTVNVATSTTCEDLVKALSTSISLGDNETLLIAEIYNNRVFQFLDNLTETIELIRDDDRLVAYRFPKNNDTSPLVVFMHQNSDTKKFGIPLLTRMPDFCKGSDIREKFLQLLHPFLMPDDFDDAYNIDKKDSKMEDIALLDLEAKTELSNDFQFYSSELGLLSENWNKVMNEPVKNETKLPKLVNVLVTWPDKMIEKYDTSLLSFLPEIYKQDFFSMKPQSSVSLYKCIELFLKEEPLGPEDMWYCPNCKKHERASKKLDIWRLPEILIIHLKRFTYNRFMDSKLENFVDFPIEDLNLSTYIIQNDGEVSHLYMLYAISNHYGGTGGGHYTAFVQDGHNRWYEFDDSRVSPVNVIKTSAAYLLFYRRI